MSVKERLENLKEELNLAIEDTEPLTSNEIVNLSQELDELIVLECRLRLEKYNSSKEDI